MRLIAALAAATLLLAACGDDDADDVTVDDTAVDDDTIDDDTIDDDTIDDDTIDDDTIDDDTEDADTEDADTEDADTEDADTEDADTEDLDEGFDLQLTGVAEVPGPGSEDGTGTASITLGEGEVCVEADVTLDDPPLAMHIHEGTVDEAGPVVVGFDAPTRDSGWSTCVDADQALIDEIAASPDDYYLNVHNAEFPDGAVRGQLGSL